MMKNQMKRKPVAIITSISLAVIATSSLAAEHHGHGASTSSQSAQTSMPMGEAAGMMGEGMMEGGMMGGDMMTMMKGMHGMMHGDVGGAMMGGENLHHDANGDGITSVDELREGLLSELADFDADDDGVLDIAEFELLHAARIRSRMVDRFQALDDDGDGKVTPEEMTAPAERMQQRMDRQRASGSMPGMQGGAMQTPSTTDTN